MKSLKEKLLWGIILVFLPLSSLLANKNPEFDRGMSPERSETLNLIAGINTIKANAEDSQTYAYHLESLRRGLLDKFSILYKNVRHPCKAISNVEVYLQVCTELFRLCCNNGEITNLDLNDFYQCLSLSENLQYPIYFIDKENGNVTHDAYYTTHKILQCIDKYMIYYPKSPYREALLYELTCHCMPPC